MYRGLIEFEPCTSECYVLIHIILLLKAFYHNACRSDLHLLVIVMCGKHFLPQMKLICGINEFHHPKNSNTKFLRFWSIYQDSIILVAGLSCQSSQWEIPQRMLFISFLFVPPILYRLMDPWICSRVVPFVSDTIKTTNNIARALILLLTLQRLEHLSRRQCFLSVSASLPPTRSVTKERIGIKTCPVCYPCALAHKTSKRSQKKNERSIPLR